MVDLLKQTIETLKTKVAENLKAIRNNEITFNMLEFDNDNNNKRKHLNEIIQSNKELLSQNFDFLNVQLFLVRLLEKCQQKELMKNSNVLVKDNEPDLTEKTKPVDIFDMTVSGNLPFTTEHPLFDNEIFYAKLFEYYQENEEYEKCALLTQIKEESYEGRS